jgi:phage shock protein C
MEKKILYRSNSNKVISGVLAGVGEYFDIDPTIVRLGYVILAIATGLFPAAIGYLIAVLIIPEKPISHVYEMPKTEYTEKKEEPKSETPPSSETK